MARDLGPSVSELVTDPRIAKAVRRQVGMRIVQCIAVGRKPRLAATREPARANVRGTKAKEELGKMTMGCDTMAPTVSKLLINERASPTSWSAANDPQLDIATSQGPVPNPGANSFDSYAATLGLSRAASPTTIGGCQVSKGSSALTSGNPPWVTRA
jgi:hypothetical protein